MGHWELSNGPEGQVSFTTTSFTPANNSLLVVAFSVGLGGIHLNPVTVEDSVGLTWTQQVSHVKSSDNYNLVRIYTAPVAAGVSMTFTINIADTAPEESAEFLVHIFNYTGHNMFSPVGATVTAEGIGGTPAQITLNRTPSKSSEVLAVSSADDANSTVTEGTGWTEQYDFTTNNLRFESQTRGNSNSAIVRWEEIDNTCCGDVEAAIEIKAAGSLQKPPNNLGLVGYWSFNEGTSTVATDFSGNNKHGTLTNNPLWTSGKRGTALSFPASTDYVNLGDNFDLNTGFTVCAWARPTDIANQGYIGGKFDAGTSNGWFIRQFGTDWRMGGDSNTLLSATLVQLNTWQHLCFVGNTNPGTSIEYVNGVNVAETTLLPTLNDNAQNATIGDRYDNARNFAGDIDEVRIYSRALGATEIAALAQSGAVKFTSNSAALDNGSSLESGLVGHWTFDGADTQWRSLTVGTTSDRSGNNNHGVLQSMNRRTSPDGGKLGQAFRFDGVDDYIDAGTGASLNITGPITVAAWVKCGGGDIVNKDSNGSVAGYVLRCGATVDFVFNGQTSGVLSDVDVIDANTWHHVVGVADTVTSWIYIDGELNNTGDADPIADNSGNLLSIGAISEGGANNLDGSLDDVRIYNRALTATEVKQLYRLGGATIRP
jgi:hypothetical protein